MSAEQMIHLGRLGIVRRIKVPRVGAIKAEETTKGAVEGESEGIKAGVKQSESLSAVKGTTETISAHTVSEGDQPIGASPRKCD